MKFLFPATVSLLAVFAISPAFADVITPTASADHVGESGPAFTQGIGDLNVGSSFTFNGVTYTNIGSSNDGVQILTIPNTGNGAQPFNTSGNYLSVLGVGTLKLTFAPTSTFGFYWGSIDPTNNIEFLSGNTSVGTLTGADTALLASLAATGNQFDYAANRYVTFTDTTGTFNELILTSGQNSFEFTNVQAVPEASTWAMMILGFLGVGFLSYRKSSKFSQPSFRIA
jgi:hypothetical protein